MSGAMLEDLAEVVRLGLTASDDELWSVDQDGDVICNGEEVAWPVSNKLDAPYIAALNNWFRTHHAQIARDAEDAEFGRAIKVAMNLEYDHAKHARGKRQQEWLSVFMLLRRLASAANHTANGGEVGSE